MLPDGSAVGLFIHGNRYLARPDAVPLDPFNLPQEPTEFRTTQLNGMFGALRDLVPDFWGRRVIDRRYPDRDLAELRKAAELIEADEPVTENLQEMLDPGSSVGGARPKTVIREDGVTWLAKFPQRRDPWCNAAVEGGMLRLAARCGIRLPETRVEPVGQEKVLLVKRFDREPFEGGEIRHRMVFNALISNTDDRPRNHAMLAPGEGWRLRPAYDLTPSRSRSLEHRDLAMVAGKLERPMRSME